MILVTGAAGKTGQAVIRALVARGADVRALVHRPEQVPITAGLGARETIAGDLRDRAALARAAQGARVIYHICPNVSPDEVTIGRAAIAAARAAGVQHFVYHSVLHPQVEAMPHHWLKMRVEELLFQSGLAYTILQPAAYVQNVLAHWDRGHAIEWVADRPTVSTNFGSYLGLASYRDPARFFLESDPAAAEALLAERRSSHVFVPVSMPLYTASMCRIAGLEERDYLSGESQPAPLWPRTMMARLVDDGRPTREDEGSLDFLRLVHVAPRRNANRS